MQGALKNISMNSVSILPSRSRQSKRSFMTYNQLSVMKGESGVPKEVQIRKKFYKRSEED